MTNIDEGEETLSNLEAISSHGMVESSAPWFNVKGGIWIQKDLK